MKLIQVNIKKLHGYLNSQFNLDGDLALLVGINGGGKTSALNAINWLINLDTGKLATENYEKIEITFELDGKDYLYWATQDQNTVVIHLLDIETGYSFKDLEIKLRSDPKTLHKSQRLKTELFDIYSRTVPDEDEQETYDFIKSFPKPMNIGLDRTLVLSDNGGTDVDEDVPASQSHLSTNRLNPLQRVGRMLSREFTNHTNEILKLTRTLNETIIMSTFDEVYTHEQLSDLVTQTPPSIEILETLEKKIISFLNENHNSNSREKKLAETPEVNVTENNISKYFKSLRKLLKDNPTDKSLEYVVNLSHFSKVNKLINAFSTFEENSKQEIAPLEEFIAVINDFLIDSAKRLYFEKKTSQLKYDIIDSEGKIVESGININTLSSGERQILILFTYIKYRKEKLFMIDEPELSLHIKWQEDFLKAIYKFKKPDTQLIIATHSPEIIGVYKEKCKLFNPYLK
nr:AAA family ATPase [uncultured Pedobacter sp.]